MRNEGEKKAQKNIWQSTTKTKRAMQAHNEMHVWWVLGDKRIGKTTVCCDANEQHGPRRPRQSTNYLTLSEYTKTSPHCAST